MGSNRVQFHYELRQGSVARCEGACVSEPRDDERDTRQVLFGYMDVKIAGV
jgi:hypothetical protein